MFKVDDFLKKENIITTRVIHFSSDSAPPGAFCCAVCYLQSDSRWKIREKDIVARNQVTFEYGGTRVTFTDSLKFLSVSISQEDVDRQKCKLIHYIIFHAIEYSLHITHKERTLF